MSGLHLNRSGELEVFVRVVEQGGFSAAARTLGLTPSAVSKLITRLEARLKARLINRSTRMLQLTPEGCLFFERAVRLLADLDEAEANVTAGEMPAGQVRLNTSASFATHLLALLLPTFRELHPEISLDIVQTDVVVDLLQDRSDIAVRAGPMRSSSLLARRLGATRMVIVGAPSYLARHGEPETADDLLRHHRLGFGYTRRNEGWPLLREGRTVITPVAGMLRISDGEGLRQMALHGAGLARLAAFTVAGDIAAGRLKPVLEAWNPGDLEEFHALFLGQGGPLPARVRAVLDFLAERVRIAP